MAVMEFTSIFWAGTDSGTSTDMSLLAAPVLFVSSDGMTRTTSTTQRRAPQAQSLRSLPSKSQHLHFFQL